MKTGLSTWVVSAVLLSGCATPAPETGNKLQLQVCEQPRPQVCTMDYRPVCGNLTDGSWKTFSNGCSACADNEVEGWREQACDE